jgi:hypothetical protein
MTRSSQSGHDQLSAALYIGEDNAPAKVSLPLSGAVPELANDQLSIVLNQMLQPLIWPYPYRNKTQRNCGMPYVSARSKLFYSVSYNIVNTSVCVNRIIVNTEKYPCI